MRRGLTLLALFVALLTALWWTLSGDGHGNQPIVTNQDGGAETDQGHRPGDLARGELEDRVDSSANEASEEDADDTTTRRSVVRRNTAGRRDAYEFVGRFVDAAGRPALTIDRVSAQFVGAIVVGPASAFDPIEGAKTGLVHLLEDGKFGCSSPRAFALAASFEIAGFAEIRFVAEIAGRVYGSTATLVAPPQHSSHDLGDIPLVPWQLIASGIVVDDLGVPIRGATVLTRRSKAEQPEPTVSLSSTLQINDRRIVRMQAKADLLQSAILEARTRSTRPETLQALTTSLDQQQAAYLAAESEYRTMRRAQEHAQHRIVAQASTADDGTFALYAATAELPISLHVSAGYHTPHMQSLPGLGQWVEVRLDRTSRVHASLVIPEWLPLRAIRTRLKTSSAASEARQAHEFEHEIEGWPHERGHAPLLFEDIPTGSYDFEISLEGLPGVITPVANLTIPRGGDLRPPSLQNIDLRTQIYRYQLRATDQHGVQIPGDIPSPLLANTPSGWRGFCWKQGHCEIFAATPTLEVQTVLAGYKTERLTIQAGLSDLRFQRLNPIEVHLPGIRMLTGDDRKVRVSMILDGDTKLPQGIEGLSQRNGTRESFSRWHLTKSGGAWLGRSDVVRVPLVHNGSYRVVIRLHEEGVSGDVSIGLGSHEVILDGFNPHRITLDFSAEAIRAGIADLEARAADMRQAKQDDGF